MYSANPSKRQGNEIIPSTWGKVIAFPRKIDARSRQTVTLFSMRDRICALAWAEIARPRGITRLVFEAAGDFDDADAGEFILIYERSASWASWGIGSGPLGMTLWRSACGTTIGQFKTLPEALETLLALISKPNVFAA